MNRISGIYKITSPSGKIYIGQSINIINRKKYYETGNCKGQAKLYASIKKHGWDKHKFEIIHTCGQESLNDLEVYYIELYQSFNIEFGMNLKSGGKVDKHSDETRAKRSKSLKGRKLTQEWKDKIGAKSKGRMVGFKFSEETLKKLRRPRGKWTKPHPKKGVCMSNEQKLINHRLANVKYRRKLKEQKIKNLA